MTETIQCRWCEFRNGFTICRTHEKSHHPVEYWLAEYESAAKLSEKCYNKAQRCLERAMKARGDK